MPLLALFEFPKTSLDRLRLDDPQPRNDEERATVLAFALATKAYFDRWADNLKRGVPDARLVDLPAAGHSGRRIPNRWGYTGLVVSTWDPAKAAANLKALQPTSRTWRKKTRAPRTAHG